MGLTSLCSRRPTTTLSRSCLPAVGIRAAQHVENVLNKNLFSASGRQMVFQHGCAIDYAAGVLKLWRCLHPSSSLSFLPLQDSRSRRKFTKSSRRSSRCVSCGAAAARRAASRSATRSSTKSSPPCRTSWSRPSATASYSSRPGHPHPDNTRTHHSAWSPQTDDTKGGRVWN